MAIGNTPLGNMAIEVNLDDSKLRQSTTNMKALMKSVSAEFQANMSAVKRTGSEYDVLATRTEGLGKKFQTQEKIVKSLEDAYEKARIEAEKQGASQQQIRAMESKRAQLNKEKASLNDLSSALEKAQAEQDEMMANNRRLESSFGKLDDRIKQSADKLKGFGSRMTDLGKNLSMSMTAPLVGAGALALKTAGEYQASEAQFSTVFGKLEEKAQGSLNKISETTGLLPNSLRGTFTSISAFAKTTGASSTEALDLTTRATMAAADSASFYDKSIEEVSESLQSYLKGNYENDSALGISSTETTRNAKANELYKKSFNELSESQKQLTLLKMVEDGNKLSGALGQASRESNTLGTQMTNAKTAFADFMAEIGKPILPLAVEGLKNMAKIGKQVAERFSGMSKFGKMFTLSIAGIVAMSPLILMAVGGIASGVGALATLGAPVLLTVGAIAGLGVAFTVAYKKSETFRNIVKGALEGVGNAFNKVKGTIKGVFQLFQGKGTDGVITLSKFLPPTLVTGLTKTVEGIRNIFISMAKAVSKVFKDIGKELSTFWKQNGKMITQALKNMMAVIRPILSVLGKIFSTTFKIAFAVAKTVVVGTFKAIVGVIKGAIKVITGIIQVFSALFTGNWKKLFAGLWKICKGAIQIIWNGINLLFYGRILKGGLAFAKGFTKIFPKLWTGIKDVFVKSTKAIFKFVSEIWSKLHKNASSTLTNMYKAIGRILSNLLKNFRSIFDNIWTKTKNIFKSIFEYIPRMIGKAKDGALNGLKAMKRGLDDLMDKMKKKVVDVFGKMVDGAKELPKKLGDGIRNGAGKAVDGVKHLGNKMVGKLGGVVNGTIGGINTVTDKLGIGKKIKEWTPPKFSTGTKNGALAQSGLITVGDFGVGNGSGRRELVKFPNGSIKLFDRETTIYAEQGTEVLSNRDTEKVLRPRRFSTGTGVGAGGFFGNIGKSIVSGFGDIMDFLGEPVKFVEKMISGVMKKTGFGGLSNFGLDFAKGAFKQVKDGVLSFITKAFSEMGSDGDGGVLDISKLSYKYGHTDAYTNETGVYWHDGVDFNYIFDKVGATHSGIAKVPPFMANGYGKWIKIVQGALSVIYGHMSKIMVKDGQRVKVGDILGITGDTGFSTGPHLHYELQKYGKSFNPEPFLRKQASTSGGKAGITKSASSWRSEILRASKMMGAIVNSSDINTIIRLIQAESGGNSGVTQHGYVDENTGGNEARGLLQYTPRTFAGYKMRGHGNIFSGLDQLLTFFNNSNWKNDLYSWSRRYASGSTGWGPTGSRKRYATGGIIDHHQIAELGEEGEEVVIPLHPSRRNNAMRLLAYTALKLMPKERGGQGMANKIPNVPIKESSNDNQMINMMMTVISELKKQNELQQKQINAIEQDRYTTVEANGRVLAQVTHEYHDDFNARKQTFQPRTVI